MAVTYEQSGVSIAAGESLVERIQPLARSTLIREVVQGIGGFAGLCRLPEDVSEPLLVSSTDGVGTKLKVAFATGRHHTVGRDLVAMCVNDVVTTGARPLFLLDYFASSKLDVTVAEQVIAGIAEGCRMAGCALLGGETAELPGFYAPGEYDLAGFSVGVVSRTHLLGPERVREGDELVAVASSGLHSNGYSLARHVLETQLGLGLQQFVPELGRTLGEELLVPTRIYAGPVSALVTRLGPELHALCHVTGGGVPGNLPRILPRGTAAVVDSERPRPPIFGLIAQAGPVEDDELRRTFNLGVGLVAVVAGSQVQSAIETLESAGERAWRLGRVETRAVGQAACVEYR
ncbi:phosphoribosylformylglycinamidine cyclo-ligase [Myxococcota bacterium]